MQLPLLEFIDPLGEVIDDVTFHLVHLIVLMLFTKSESTTTSTNTTTRFQSMCWSEKDITSLTICTMCGSITFNRVIR